MEYVVIGGLFSILSGILIFVFKIQNEKINKKVSQEVFSEIANRLARLEEGQVRIENSISKLTYRVGVLNGKTEREG